MRGSTSRRCQNPKINKSAPLPASFEALSDAEMAGWTLADRSIAQTFSSS
jgi:hypothetical protein